MEQQPSGSKGFDMAAMALGSKIIMVGGILLLVDSFLKWQKICFGFAGVQTVCGGASAWNGSGGFFGLLMGLSHEAMGRARAPMPAPDWRRQAHAHAH